MVKAEKSISRQSFSSAELAIWIVIASVGMLFGTFLLSYLLAKARFPVWPPVGIDPIPAGLPWVSTLFLLLSSFMVSRSVFYWEQNNIRRSKYFWLNGLLLGTAFMFSQIFLWDQLVKQGLDATEHLYAGAVYALTGIHALHVLAGLVALSVVYFRFSKLKANSEAPKLVGLIWHFLDIVWILMFLLMVVF